MKVIVVDYNAGNLFSVEQACKMVGLEPVVSGDPQEIAMADAIILPGVGAFPDAMRNLEQMHLIAPIKDAVARGKPFLGICLGMQLLFSTSEEFGVHQGLSLIEGKVVKFPALGSEGQKIKVPQTGWNRVYHPSSKEVSPWDGQPLEAIHNGEFMYFVHSFFVCPARAEDILAVTEYEGIRYCSAVKKDNIFAMQFHPEKSAAAGLKIYGQWAQHIRKG